MYIDRYNFFMETILDTWINLRNWGKNNKVVLYIYMYVCIYM